MAKVDGHTRIVLLEDLEPGVVLRMVNEDGTSWPFADCFIEKVTDNEVFLCRPHSLGVERYKLFKDSNWFGTFISPFRMVLDSNGKPYKTSLPE